MLRSALLVSAIALGGAFVHALPSVPVATPSSLTALAQDDLDLVGPVRAGVRWLRTQQDVETGAYGGVVPTALAVRAFATSPDRYRSVDGPFVRLAVQWLVAHQAEDGSIADAGANDAARRESTAQAVAALMALSEPEHAAAMAKAMAFLGPDAAGEATRWPTATAKWPLTQDEQVAAARKMLAAQVERGRWDGPRGTVAETAAHMVSLSSVEALLASQRATAAPAAKVEPLPAFTAADRAAASKALGKGAAFLAAASDNGKWGAPGKPEAGLSAMILASMLCEPAPRPPEHQKVIDAGLAWLASLQQPDGSIHDGKLANYTTSAAIMAFARSGDERFKPVIEKARAFLVGLQADEGEGYSEGDLYYGGIGYGSAERPDLSNLQMALEALSASGLEPNAPTYKKALKFLERCQNRSESNDIAIEGRGAVIRSGNDGGAAYAPGDSKAGFTDLEGGARAPRSYGSMTYALLKCMVFAGLDASDPRMKAAYEWVRAHYTLDVNPGFEGGGDASAPYQGLFYYLHTMAQTLDLMHVDKLVDNAGMEHAWRAELCGRIVSMQSKLDGSWINRNSPRWYEGNPLLGTAYALLTLDAAMPR